MYYSEVREFDLKLPTKSGQKIVMEFHFMSWLGALSSFFRIFGKISQSLSLFGIFIVHKEEGVFQLCHRILPKKKLSNQMSRYACKRNYYAMPTPLCFSDIFLHF